MAMKASLIRKITTADISRPGLEMTGYFDYYTPERNSIGWDERGGLTSSR